MRHAPNSDKVRWTARDGRKILVCDLDDDHLQNLIAFVARKCEAIVDRALDDYPVGLNGEYAQMAAEQGWDFEMQRASATAWRYAALLELLCAEADCRGLSLLP